MVVEKAVSFALVEQGVGLRAAVRRAVRQLPAPGPPAPVEPLVQVISPRFLNEDERIVIADLRRKGVGAGDRSGGIDDQQDRRRPGVAAVIQDGLPQGGWGLSWCRGNGSA